MKKQSWSALLSGKNGVHTLVFAGGSVLYAVDIYVTITALPSLINDIGSGGYSWAMSIFTMASLIGTLLSTRILGKIGLCKTYIFSALIFAVGAFMCSIAPTMLLFLIGRFIQGFAGGSLLSLPYSMVRIVFDPSLWSRALSIISGMWGISTLLGPAIGGLSIQYGTWRASFWTVGILAIIFLFTALKILPKDRKEICVSSPPLPLLQLFVLVLSIFIISTGSAVDTTIAKICGLVTGVGLLFVLAKIESSTHRPMLPHKTFSFSSKFLPIYSLMFIMCAIACGVELYFPLFLQELYKKDPLTAGYIAALLSLGWTCGSLLSASAPSKKIHKIIVYSPISNLLSISVLLWLIPTEASAPGRIFIICLALFSTGISFGVAWPHLLALILQCASHQDALRAGESLTSVQLFSTAFGAALAEKITNLASLFSSGEGVKLIFEAKILLAVFIGLLLCVCIPFSLRISNNTLKNKTE
ncbi:major facilitator family transporter [Bartonella australis AUST/NH1]|uniref:Major facilitator family transporter n=1 Tax=Bartonella australis (strain Aust/NH1) TaxID=1094489 RepID=M1PDF5_BARAA|nr:MFS transporter [Bartonella australis]AGF74621.1 major facilitator family transporter [Bartonella australis AUST/NH1]